MQTVATCCNEPMISTIVYHKCEKYCIFCGFHCGVLTAEYLPPAADHETRLKELTAEFWKQRNAGVICPRLQR